MRHWMGVALLLGAATAVAETNLAQFVCQRMNSKGHLLDYVVIVEQTSTKAIDPIDGVSPDTVDGSNLIDPDSGTTAWGEYYSGTTTFRMRFYKGVSLVSADKTKEEIVESLLQQPASAYPNGELMDFTGKGSRFFSGFGFESMTSWGPKSFTLDLDDLGWGRVGTANGAVRMLEDGPYRCEEPVLVPQ